MLKYLYIFFGLLFVFKISSGDLLAQQSTLEFRYCILNEFFSIEDGFERIEVHSGAGDVVQRLEYSFDENGFDDLKLKPGKYQLILSWNSGNYPDIEFELEVLTNYAKDIYILVYPHARTSEAVYVSKEDIKRYEKNLKKLKKLEKRSKKGKLTLLKDDRFTIEQN